MKRNLFFVSSLTIALFSCGNPEGGIVQKAIDHPVPEKKVLKPEEIYSTSAVLSFAKSDGIDKSESQQLFLQGVDFYRNQSNLDSAIFKFEQAVLKAPSAQLYYELGCANRDQNNLSTAKIAFEVAEQLGYEPFNKVLYNLATVHSLKDDTEMASKYLTYAIQAGFNDIDLIESDTSLNNIRDSYTFEQAIKKGLRGVSDPRKMQWINFKKQFPKLTFPIAPKNILADEEMEDFEFISFDFERFVSEMRDEKFSREVSKGFYYYATVFENENCIGLLYMEREEFMGNMYPAGYRLVTFTPEGKLIDKMTVSGMEANREMREVQFFDDGAFDVVAKKVSFEKDIDEYGFYDNPIEIGNVIAESCYQIEEDGTFTLVQKEEFKDKSIEKDVAIAQ